MPTLTNEGKYAGPHPVIHPDNEDYWKAVGEGELKLQQCDNCQTIRFPLAPVCYKCGSMEAHWVPVPADGNVSAAIRIERATGDQLWAVQVPLIAGQVDLENGMRLPGRIFCACGEALEHGTPVTGSYQEVEGGYGVLCFTHRCAA